MSAVKKNVFRRTLAVVGAAVSAAAAVRNHRRPSDAALRELGIDPAGFPSVREF
ncbi:hypothetical protein NOF55_05360 [Rhizobiaceae bacterium BDR2-2]|uniref:Uncharacterized protein n=1 Tax=Ectorhizobium quercum TaxID=2965071 RepID=A0AAE3N0D7_9HYPH|nr:hypothetical protein [Ectorhizobium quercum]MCX8996527.1 hypothetical protein [Ectorhizobium quercum]